MMKIIARSDRHILSHPLRYWSRENAFEYGPDQPIGRAIKMKAKKCTETLIPLLLEGETDQEIIRRNIHSAIVACIESTSIEHLQQILDIDNMDQYIDQKLYN